MEIQRQRLSNRAFGFAVTVVVLAFVAVRTWWTGDLSYGGLVVAASFAATASLAPAVLLPLARLWLALAGRLERLTNALVLSIALYGIVTPTGLIMRLLGRDLLGVRLDPGAESYLQPVTRQTESDTLRDIF